MFPRRSHISAFSLRRSGKRRAVSERCGHAAAGLNFVPAMGLGIVALMMASLDGCSFGQASSPPARTATAVAGRAIKRDTSRRIFLIVMENKSASQILGNPNAPFINHMARTYGYAANYFAVTHPSLPNYVSLIAGTTFGQPSDDEGQRFPGPSLPDQLVQAGLTWRGYMESMPRPGFEGNNADSGLYRRKHDPFMLMTSILHNPRQRRNVVPASYLSRDLRSGRVPNFSFITPNMCHDMHGLSTASCPSSTVGLIKTGDKYLSGIVPQIMSSRAWRGNAAIFIVWDEDDGLEGGAPGFQGGRVPAIIISRQGKQHFASHHLYDHYSLLKTLQHIWKLPCLQNTCRPSIHTMTEFLRP